MAPGNARPDAAPSARAAGMELQSPQALAELSAQMGLALSPQQCATLLAYAQLLRRWNRVHNLTAVDSDADVLSHHLLDCLAILVPIEQALERFGGGIAGVDAVHFLDAGSGGGLPGIPLAIARPRWRGTLVDAVQKKCAFLQQAKVELGLGNIAVQHARLESAGIGAQDVIVSRAFAALKDFTALTAHLLKPGGLWIAMKGRRPDEELAALPGNIDVLDTSTLRVPLLGEERHLVVLRPRTPAMPPQPPPAGGASGLAAP
jgi:16S rRNA (guanine527-N7)-methyltransferase